MGLLINGVWHDQWYDTKATQGKFVRSEAQFRNQLVAPSQFDPNDPSHFLAESERYHLYVSLACPWAHRTLIFRHLKNLEDHISVSCVHPHMLENGWEFKDDANFADPYCSLGDPLYNFAYAHQLYTHADAAYSGRVTVPILWDKKQHTIVSNESAEIIRMLNHAFNEITHNHDDYYPVIAQPQIDDWNNRIYHNVNNGVYKAGFATTQAAYEEALVPLFDTLDSIEAHLTQHAYLAGEQITEADWRLFTTLIRFDAVYHGHFKCNLKRIIDYPHINAYLSRLYRTKNVAQTVNLAHIKHHYYFSHTTINPTQVVPAGPATLFDTES